MSSRRFKPKSLFWCILVCTTFMFIHLGSRKSPVAIIWDSIFPYGGAQVCNRDISWSSTRHPKTGLLGPKGSGVLWLRYLIEQAAGTYTGSVREENGNLFRGEGITNDQVSVVFSEHVHKVAGIQKAIVVYRGMKDTVRSHFGKIKGSPTFGDAPAGLYREADWITFAKHKGNEWAEMYQGYIGAGTPLLLVRYEDLLNSQTLNTQLQRIANFLGVPLKSSALDCLKHSSDFFLKPTPLHAGFQPFNYMAIRDLTRLERLEREVEQQISKKNT